MDTIGQSPPLPRQPSETIIENCLSGYSTYELETEDYDFQAYMNEEQVSTPANTEIVTICSSNRSEKEVTRKSFWRHFQSVRWRGVLALIAGVFMQMLGWGLIMTYGTILAFYVRYLVPHTSESLIALAGAIPPFILLSLALLWGRLLDAGHHRLLNIMAGVFLVGGLIGLAFTGSNEYKSGKLWAIILASIPMGIGQSMYSMAAPQTAKTWYAEHKGLAMGITNCGAAIGGIIWPFLFDALVENHGFRAGVGALAAIAAALAIFIAIFSTPDPAFKRHAVGDAFNFWNWWPTGAFHSRVYVFHVISMAFIYAGILGIPFFIELWGRRRQEAFITSEDTTTGNGIDLTRSNGKKLGVYLVVIMNACSLPGRLLGSTLCDKIRARKIHAVACIVAVILIASCWFTVDSFAGAGVFVALYGLTHGIMVSLPFNDIQDILGDRRTYLLGQYHGAVATCSSPFILGGAVAVGALVRSFNVLIAPGAWCIGCFSVGALFMLLGVCAKDDTVCFESERESEFGGPTRIGSEVSLGHDFGTEHKKRNKCSL